MASRTFKLALSLLPALLLGLGGKTQAQPENFITFLNTNGIPVGNPGTPVKPALLRTGMPPRGRIFFVGGVGDLGPERIEEVDGTLLFCVFGGGKDFHPVNNPTAGLIPVPAPVNFTMTPSAQTVAFNPQAVLTALSNDDLGVNFEDGDFVYVALFINGDGQDNTDGNGCLPLANWSYGMQGNLVNFPSGIPAVGLNGLTITVAGDNDNTMGSDLGNTQMNTNPSVVFSLVLNRLFGFFVPPIPSVAGGNAVPQPSNLCGPNPPPAPATLPHSRVLYFSSPFGPCTSFTTFEGSNAAVVQLASLNPCSFPKFQCTNLVMNPAAGPPGTPVTITMTVANQGSLVGSVNTSLNIQPAGSINLTTPVPQVLTIDTSAPGGPTMNAVFNGTIANNASGNITVNGVLDLNGPTGVPYNRAPFGAGEFVVLLPNQTCTSNFQVETPVVICESLSSDTVVITPCAPVNFTLRLRNTSNINGTVDVRVDANPANGFQCGPPLFQQSNVAVNANSVRVLNFNCNLSCTPPPQIDLVTTLTGVGGTRVPDPSPAVCRLTLRGGQVIPTLSEWGLIALTLALGAGLFLVRRRTV